MNADQLNGTNWLSLSAAAAVLGSTPLNVLMHVKRGHLLGIEGESGWLVDPASLATLLDTRRAGDAPTVCSRSCARKTGGCGSCK